MKYVKMLGLLAVAAAALMAFAGSASATVTSPTGTVYTGELHATSEGNTTLDGSVNITCSHSSARGTVTAGATTGPVSTLTFTGCGKDTVSVITGGHLTVESSGTTKSTGAEVTVLTHFSFFNITTHCIYRTNNTDVGTLTDSHDRGGSTATLDIGSAPIPEVNTDGLCGNDAVWTGNYEVTTPMTLYVD